MKKQTIAASLFLLIPFFLFCIHNDCHNPSYNNDNEDYISPTENSLAEADPSKFFNPDQYITINLETGEYTSIPASQVKKKRFYIKNYEEQFACNLLNKYLVTESSVIPEWLVQASKQNAPPLLQGIFKYLEMLFDNPHYVIPSYNRFILVGEPGAGKTTLALAMAHTLDCEAFFVPISELGGKIRGETALNLMNIINNVKKLTYPVVVILDEINKLFENYQSECHDTAENSTAFWQMLDTLEKNHLNVIVIGTANSVDKLPPQLKSRFHGKIVNLPLPNKNQKAKAFKHIIVHDRSIQLGKSVNKAFIKSLVSHFNDYSMRDIQLLVDTAKIFKYAETTYNKNNTNLIVLEKKHFELAFQQLEKETDRYNFYKKITSSLKEVSPAVHTIAELIFLGGIFSGAIGMYIEKCPHISNFFATT